MAIRVGINGFGRIGRLVFRAICDQGLLGKEIEVVAVNDIVPADNLAYLVKYDSTQGRFPGTRHAARSPARTSPRTTSWCVNGHEIKCLAIKDGPAALPWKALGVDIVIESTGLFTDAAKAKGHLDAGAKKVIISRPGQGRRHHHRAGRQRRQVRPGQAQHHLQRELHDELPRAGRPRAAEGRLRRRRRPDDDHPQLHGDAEDGRRPVEEGLEGRPHRRASTSSPPRPAPPRPSAW